MPYFNYSPQRRIKFFWEVPFGKRGCASCVDDGNATSISGDKGETSSSYKTKYEKLPHSLKFCLDYCSLICYIARYGWMREKKRVVRLMVAGGLIEDKAGETNASSLEDIASSFIDELVSLGMLIQTFGCVSYDLNTTVLNVPEPYLRLCVVDWNKNDPRNVDSPIRVVIYAQDDAEISHHLKNLPIQSLFLSLSPFYNKLSQAAIDTIFGLRSLLVLALTGSAIGFLFNEVGEDVNLSFLSLNFPGSRGILLTLGNFPHLQTLESNNLYAVPEKVSHIKTLRHLPTVDARCDKIGELSSLTQLRSLRVRFVAHENIDELLNTIMTMKNLTSLSMQAESFWCQHRYINVLPHLEPFSPPPLLQEFRLEGILIEFTYLDC